MAQYAQIVGITAPGQALAGDQVNISVSMQNLADYGFYVAITGDAGGSPIDFTPDYAGVNPGAACTFYGSFVMPGNSVTINVTSWWWGDDNTWHSDDITTKVVSLVALSPQVSEFQIADFSRV